MNSEQDISPLGSRSSRSPGTQLLISSRTSVLRHCGERTANSHALIAEADSAFNRRDIDGALAVTRENLDSLKASGAGRVIGKEEIRAYWAHPWAEIHPIVEPIETPHHAAGLRAAALGPPNEVAKGGCCCEDPIDSGNPALRWPLGLLSPLPTKRQLPVVDINTSRNVWCYMMRERGDSQGGSDGTHRAHSCREVLERG